MDKIKIIGGASLDGRIKVSGSKNSALPILAATLLTDEEIIIKNVPHLSDIDSMLGLLKSLNVKINFQSNICYLHPRKPKSFIAPYDLVRKMRASFLILGALLAKYGKAEVSMPGGCAIGLRPVDLHIDALKKMGAKFDITDGYVKGKVIGKLKGTEIRLKKVSVGATENIMIAATLAEGKTIIKNAAREPEISDLAKFLIKMGADIKGIGTNRIIINGKEKLNRCNYKIMPDRIEAGTFSLCVLGCTGKIILEKVNSEISEHLIKIFSPLKQMKLRKLLNGKELEVSCSENLLFPVKIKTSPYPGFPTDLQAQLTAVMTVSSGKSEIKENIFENRFMHVSELKRMSADLVLDRSKVVVLGKKKIFGAEVMATDLRASSCLIIAGLMAEGKTIINRVYHLDRGYENIEKKLKKCGASIERI